jgi:hypothetical protein
VLIGTERIVDRLTDAQSPGRHVSLVEPTQAMTMLLAA